MAANKDTPLLYTVLGYWIRQKVKTTWLMAILSLSLKSMKDDYLGLMLFIQGLHMCMDVHVSDSRKLTEGLDFMKHNIKAGFPPNTFTIINTHSNKYSRMLQHTGGHTSGTNTIITEIMTMYLGNKFLKDIENALLAARSNITIATTKKGK
ncbi:hypothetical protein DFH29DRAFT_881739 [Suillus ampliporus]|nr:hypothetical protein DFH29DRAFT_881739 [Suillus ampliporus]